VNSPEFSRLIAELSAELMLQTSVLGSRAGIGLLAPQ
jgi:hypothetical protein